MSGSTQLMKGVPGFSEKRPGKILELCEYLTPVMNELHEADYSQRFWSMMLKDYVKTCVNRELLISDEILHSRPSISPMQGWELPTRKDKWRARIRELLMAVYERHSISKINKILKVHENICVGIRGKEFERFGLGTYCPPYHTVTTPFLDKKLRGKLSHISEREESFFLKNVILQLPRYYVEDFKKNIAKIELHDPEKKTFHAEHLSGFMDFVIALYVEHGAKYYRYQLGGGMGETKDSVSPDKYIDIDKLRTYGWKIHEKDEPHVAYRLEQFRRNFDDFTPETLVDICIVYNQINVASRERYKSISDKLFEKLDFEKYPQVLLRPRGFTKKLDNSGELTYLDPPGFIAIDQGKKPMHEIVKAAWLIVQLSHPGTNFLECVYVNHPVVTIQTNNRPTDIIRPFYDFFLEQKVMHETADSLITHLNSTDLEQWWEEVISHPMYLKFKDQFAREV